MVARRLLDMLGIQRETIALSKRAGFRSPTRSFSVEERDKQRAQLRYFYEKLFLPRVAEGRRLKLEQVDEVARGRVWTGRQGMERGLIDELGDLEAAIELARKRAGIAPEKKVRVVTYVKRPRLRSFSPSDFHGGRGAARVRSREDRCRPSSIYWVRWRARKLCS